MYDLTVSNVHTFAVGDGQWVVHNTTCSNASLAQLAHVATKQFVDGLPDEPGKGKGMLTVGAAVAQDTEGENIMERRETDHELIEQLCTHLGKLPKSTTYDEQGSLIELDFSESGLTQIPEQLGHLETCKNFI
jgi:hypothetical protein